MIKKLRCGLILSFIFALFASAAALCACQQDKQDPSYYGLYISGTGSRNAAFLINEDGFYLGDKRNYYQYKFDYSYDNGVIKVDGLSSDFYLFENNQVLCYASINRGLKLNVRNGLFSERYWSYDANGFNTSLTFNEDGSYSIMEIVESYSENGKYTLNSGVIIYYTTLLLNTDYDYVNEEGEQHYGYVDENYNLYLTAFIKNPEQFAGNGTDTSNPTPPEDDDTPVTPDSETYTLNYSATEGGRIVGTTTQTVKKGGSGDSVIAIANEGYEFMGWSDGVTTAERTDTNVAEDITVTAQFEEIKKYTLTYSATTGGYIAGESEQIVEEGANGSAVTAVANEGYKFVGWSDGVTAAERRDTSVADDITVTAQFELNNTTQFAGGSGTQANPYKISTAEHLKNIALYPGAHFILISDITLPQAEEGRSNFTPLFSDETMFSGSLNGNGHTVYNLTIYNTSTFYTGLFSCIGAEGSVANLTLEYVNLNGTNYIGGIAGYAIGAVTDCTVSGEITYISQNGYSVFLGGIAGRAENSVNGCSSAVDIFAENVMADVYAGGIAGYYSYAVGEEEPALTVTSSAGIYLSDSESGYGYPYAGGIFGYLTGGINVADSYFVGDMIIEWKHLYAEIGGLAGHGDGDSIFASCYFAGDITVTTGHYSYVGGLVGRSGVSAFISCYSTGDITVTAAGGCEVGGLLGVVRDGHVISCCYSTGDITVHSNRDADCIGGLIGRAYNSGTLSNCYTASQIKYEGEKQEKHIGALAGEADELTIINTHWLYYAESGVEYAVGYSSDMGIPTSIGSTRHTDIADFYALAQKLNEGLETPAWENIGDSSLPTLKKENN